MTNPVQSLVLRRLASVQYEEVARRLGRDVPHVSRIASGERGIRIDELDALFDALGISAGEVGGDAVTLPAEEVRAMRVLARKGLRFIGGEE